VRVPASNVFFHYQDGQFRVLVDSVAARVSLTIAILLHPGVLLRPNYRKKQGAAFPASHPAGYRHRNTRFTPNQLTTETLSEPYKLVGRC
jgi:hypothetical protein